MLARWSRRPESLRHVSVTDLPHVCQLVWSFMIELNNIWICLAKQPLRGEPDCDRCGGSNDDKQNDDGR